MEEQTISINKILIAIKKSLLQVLAVTLIFAMFGFLLSLNAKEEQIAYTSIFVDFKEVENIQRDTNKLLETIKCALLSRDFLSPIFKELDLTYDTAIKDVEIKVKDKAQIVEIKVKNPDLKLSKKTAELIAESAKNTMFINNMIDAVKKIETIEKPCLTKISDLSDNNKSKKGNNDNKFTKPALMSLLGLFLAMTVVVFREIFVNPCRSLKDIQDLNNLQPLAEIPASSLKKDQKVFPFITDSSFNPQYLEAYRTLRTNLKYAMESSKVRSNIIMITSTLHKESSSEVAINLAISLGLSSNKVLLMDFDFRGNPVSDILNLSGDAKDDASILDIKKIRYLENLHIYFSPTKYTGRYAPELLSSKDIKNFLSEVSDRYDYIICNTPPLLEVADALSLSEYVGGTVFVVNYGTAFKTAREAREILEKSNTPVLGAVLNNCDA